MPARRACPPSSSAPPPRHDTPPRTDRGVSGQSGGGEEVGELLPGVAAADRGDPVLTGMLVEAEHPGADAEERRRGTGAYQVGHYHAAARDPCRLSQDAEGGVALE